ncbi:MAG: SAM hydrolase/SAM-dependent halogenase family protein [Anaerolineales bacterium]
MSFITLITDFGLKDGNVGVMKGVIWRIAPQIQVADLSHLIAPQNIQEAGLILLRSAPYFPQGTVHVVVVDPGVGTDRRPIGARLGEQYFIGPDNGVLTMWLERSDQQALPVQIVHLDRPEFWLPDVSHVFHGRDIFAPAAAHLANGTPLQAMGSPVHDPIRLSLPQPVRTDHGLSGEVIHVDHFGNISTNIRREHLIGEHFDRAGYPVLRLGGVEIHGLVKTFGERPPGDLVALFGSTGNLIVSVVNGSAVSRLGVAPGDTVELNLG